MRDLPAKLQSVEDARYFARRRLPAFLFQLFESGAGAGLTVRDNEHAFADVHFLPRAGVSHPERDLTTTVLGHRVSMPVLAAPVGLLRFGHRDGEIGVARAARRGQRSSGPRPGRCSSRPGTSCSCRAGSATS